MAMRRMRADSLLATVAAVCLSLVPACKPGTPRYPTDAELKHRFEQHRAEFEELRQLSCVYAGQLALLRRTEALSNTIRSQRGDSLATAHLKSPRLLTLKTALDLQRITVYEDSTAEFVTRSPTDSRSRQEFLDDEKGIMWSPGGVLDVVSGLDTLHHDAKNLQSMSTTYHVPLGGGWHLFREFQNWRWR